MSQCAMWIQQSELGVLNILMLAGRKGFLKPLAVLEVTIAEKSDIFVWNHVKLHIGCPIDRLFVKSHPTRKANAVEIQSINNDIRTLVSYRLVSKITKYMNN